MSAVAWVTGSAGGIGAGVCRRLRADGFTVVGFDLRPSPDADVSIECDLADAAATLEAVGRATADSTGSVGALVHVAATQQLAGAGELSAADWARTFQVNVVALDLLAGAARASLAAARGSIVAISSVHATATTQGIIGYETSKAALHGWVRGAALDLGPDIRVNAVAPGAIDTDMLTEGFDRWGAEVGAVRRATLEERTPLGRIGRVEDVADAVAFLVGPHSAFVTGSVLTVDGGALTRLGTE